MDLRAVLFLALLALHACCATHTNCFLPHDPQTQPKQSRGADPSILADEADPYLDPGRKRPLDVAPPSEALRARLAALEARYAGVHKAPLPHADAGDWWALYDYGPEAVCAWPADYKPDYPGARARTKGRVECPLLLFL